MVNEFSFARGGWLQREAVSVAQMLHELQQHPGQFRELYLAKDMPLLVAGARALKADCWRLTNNEAQGLAKVLRSDRGLRSLLLQDIKLSGFAVEYLFSSLKGPRAAGLQSLSLLRMDLIGDLEMSVADMLRGSCWVQQLNLSGSSVSAQGAASLASALRFNTTLERLDLENSKFLDAGASALAGALISNGRLTSLMLRGNEISDTGAIAIAGALRVNRGLSQLDLHSNDIADAGASAIATSLRSNCTLERLDLRNNMLSTQNKTMLEEALRHNEKSSMTKLMLWDNASEIFQQAALDPGPIARQRSRSLDKSVEQICDRRDRSDSPSQALPQRNLARCPAMLGSAPPMLASHDGSLPSFGLPAPLTGNSRMNGSMSKPLFHLEVLSGTAI